MLAVPLALLVLGTPGSSLASSSAFQGEPKGFTPVDPYTKNDPGIVKKAGYVSLGPFRFGDDHTSDEARQKLDVPVLWVETEHFKLGSALGEYALADEAEKKRVLGELARLAEKLPDVKLKTKKLDPWLRLHLFALRLEELYGQFLGAFRLRESEFPLGPRDPKAAPAGPDMGDGPFLGMPGKFAVLLLEKKASAGRYGRIYLGREVDGPTRQLFPKTGTWLFLTASEFLGDEQAADTALACLVVGGVAQDLALGFRGPRVGLCFAASEGIAHWFAQRVDPRYHPFAGADPAPRLSSEEGGWGPPVRARVEHKVFPSTQDMLGWSASGALEWADHLVLWSRFDYLLAREDGAAGTFLRRLKEPPPGGAAAPAPDELVERARTALAESTGGDLTRFDQDWSEWVLKTYPKK